MLMCLKLLIISITSSIALSKRHSQSVSTLPLLWLSTRNEGLAEHWSQLNKIWFGLSSKCNRSVQVVPFKSDDHYTDAGYINMCDYFVMPKGITCGNQTPEEVVRSVNPRCSMLGCNPRTWYCKPDAFGLGNTTTFRKIVDVRRPNYCNDTCSLLKSNLPVNKGVYFPIKFTAKFESLFNLCFTYLNERTRASSSSTLTVVHWRRGDQILSRCHSNVDISVNCRSAEVFIDKVRNHTRNLSSLVYVSTNENKPDILKKLSDAGMLSWRSFGFMAHKELKSIDVFIVELMLMINATTFLYWGSSTIPSLVNAARSQKSDSINKMA